MKELTIEQKALAYDEALDIAKHYHSGMGDDVKCVLEECFSELRESDDEKIRKYLIDVVNDYCKGSEYEGCIAWLEKQGEQKLADKVETKFKVGDTIYYKSFDKVKSIIVSNVVTDNTDNSMYEDANGNAVFEKDLVEQKHVWSREDEQNLNAALGYIDDEYLRRWLKDVIYNKYEKSTLSEEDERMRKDLISHFEETIENIKSEEIIPHHAKILVGKMQKWIAWLEKQGEQKSADIQLIEKRAHEVFPDDDDENTLLYRQAFIDGAVDYIDCGCKNIAWSEEDKRRINHIITFMSDKERIKDTETMFPIEEDIRWLKSIKARHTWKPSDELMKLLRKVQQALLSKDCYNRFVDFRYELKN